MGAIWTHICDVEMVFACFGPSMLSVFGAPVLEIVGRDDADCRFEPGDVKSCMFTDDPFDFSTRLAPANVTSLETISRKGHR